MSVDPPRAPPGTSKLLPPRSAQGASQTRSLAGAVVQSSGISSFAPLKGVASNDDGSLDLLGTLVPFHAGSQFYGETDSARHVYRLVTGVARGYHITADGRRQIVAFYVPGDIFGIEDGETHSLYVDALTDGRVQVIKRTAIANLVSTDPYAAERLWAKIAGELHRDHDHILRLSKSAKERVASFLLEMSERLSDNGMVHLPMSRQEIAEYLGLTIETVSRSLTQLKTASIISISGPRRISILDHKRLSRITL